MKLLRIFILFIYVFTVSEPTEESGPYRFYMLYINNRCNQTIKPYETVPSATSYFWPHKTKENTSLVDANITVFQELKNMKATLRFYHMENGKRYLDRIVEKIECRSLVMTVLAKLWGYKPSKDYCTIPKGTYFLKNMNFNKAAHLWDKEMQYGVTLRRVEVVRGSKTVLCFETVMKVVPVSTDTKIVAATREPLKNKKT